MPSRTDTKKIDGMECHRNDRLTDFGEKLLVMIPGIYLSIYNSVTDDNYN